MWNGNNSIYIRDLIKTLIVQNEISKAKSGTGRKSSKRVNIVG